MICKRCGNDTENFYSKQNKCVPCIIELRIIRYHTDKDYLIAQRYNDMKRRADGKTEIKSGAAGLPILSKQEFLQWCKDTERIFNKLWEEWKNNGYTSFLAPSIDRIDSKRGYERNNIQWLTWYDNLVKNNREHYI